MDRTYIEAHPNGDHSNKDSDNSSVEAENEALLYNLVYHTKELYEEQNTPYNTHGIDSLFTVNQKTKVFRLDAVKDIVKYGAANSKGPVNREVNFSTNNYLNNTTGNKCMPSEIQVHNNNYGNIEITKIDTNSTSLSSVGGKNASTNNGLIVFGNKSFNNSNIKDSKLSENLNTTHGFSFEKNGKSSIGEANIAIETVQEDYLQIRNTKDLKNAKEGETSNERYCNSMKIVRRSDNLTTREKYEQRECPINNNNNRESVIIEREQKLEHHSSTEKSKYDLILKTKEMEAMNKPQKYVNTIETVVNSNSDVIHGKECEIISITSSDSDGSVVELHIPPPSPPPMISLQSSEEDAIVIVSDEPKKRSKKRKRKNNLGNVCDSNNSESQQSSSGTSHLSNLMEQSSDNLLVLYSAPEKCRVNVPGSFSTSDVLIHCSDKQNSKKTNKKNKSKRRKVEEKEGNLAPSCHPLSWTPSMVQFYDLSWGGETYDHIKLLKNMSGQPSKWRILDSDRFDPLFMKGEVGKVRCRNCNQLGHKAFHCPDPRKIPRCYMCGEPGHQEPRCPNKLCLKCGSPSYMYVHGCAHCQKPDLPSMCDSCGQYGHYMRLCPSSWRTFHSVTTEEEAITVSHAVSFKPKQLQFCCNCAEQGHHVDNCGFLHAPFRFPHPYKKLSRTHQEKKLQIGNSLLNGIPAHKMRRSRTHQEKKLQVENSLSNGIPVHKTRRKRAKKSKIKKMSQPIMPLDMRNNQRPSKRVRDLNKKHSRAFLINKYIN